MSFNNFAELQDLIRSYNSKSILEIGTRICWKVFYNQNNSDPLIYLLDNAKRGYAIRIMLLASMGNPHRRKNIDEKTFHTYIDDYYNFGNHTIAYPNVLDQEAETIFRCIQNWEVKNKSKVRNWLLKLSDIFDTSAIRQYTPVLFMQRQAAFQNEGFGQSIYRVHRTIKFIELLESRCNENFRENFLKSTGLSLEIYFKQFGGCIVFFTSGYCGFSKFPDMDIPEYGITNETLKLFIQQNSAPFHSESETSFCRKVIKKLQSTPDFYKLFLYNFFLEKPFIEFSKYQFYLLDHLSLTESCRNQIESLISEYETSTFCHKVIKKLQNTPNFYKPFFYNFFLEKALDIKDKPVIPLVLTFYDSIGSSALLTAMIKNSDYCDRMGLKIPPIVYSIHEFEHWISDRSLDNWAELILQRQNNLVVEPDNQGHSYKHLADINLL